MRSRSRKKLVHRRPLLGAAPSKSEADVQPLDVPKNTVGYWDARLVPSSFPFPLEDGDKIDILYDESEGGSLDLRPGSDTFYRTGAIAGGPAISVQGKGLYGSTSSAFGNGQETNLFLLFRTRAKGEKPFPTLFSFDSNAWAYYQTMLRLNGNGQLFLQRDFSGDNRWWDGRAEQGEFMGAGVKVNDGTAHLARVQVVPEKSVWRLYIDGKKRAEKKTWPDIAYEGADSIHLANASGDPVGWFNKDEGEPESPLEIGYCVLTKGTVTEKEVEAMRYAANNFWGVSTGVGDEGAGSGLVWGMGAAAALLAGYGLYAASDAGSQNQKSESPKSTSSNESKSSDA